MTEALFSSAHELILPFVLCLVPALAMASLFRWARPRWGLARTSVIAALPLPALAIAFCAWVFVRAATSTAKHCGVDACGMAMGFSVILAIDALVIFALTALICHVILRLMRRPA